MTRSNIALTEGGGGKKQATEERTVGGIVVQAPYTQIDEPALPTFTAFVTASVATTADHVLQLMAPAGSYVRIHRIKIEQVASATAASLQTFTILRLTTAGTGGTSITPRPFDTADTVGATAMSIPTAKGTEGVSLLSTVIVQRQAIGATTSQVDDYYEWKQTPGKKPIIIPAGTANGIAVKIGTGTAGASANIEVEFTETAWL